MARLDGGNGFLNWMSAREISSSGMSDAEVKAYWTKRAWQLSEAGINLNYAPVVDLDVNPDNPVIGKLGRAFGNEPGQVSRMAELFIRAHRDAGVKTVLKHFPGHGSSSTDSHKDTADISKSWKENEYEPFANMMRGGLVDGVMNGHLVHPRFSDESWMPASLSWNSVKEIRQTLGFQGAIITDDMHMAAVEDLMPLEAAAVAAVNAGNTFLIYSNYRKSDKIDTVERVTAALVRNLDRMSGRSHRPNLPGTRVPIAFALKFCRLAGAKTGVLLLHAGNRAHELCWPSHCIFRVADVFLADPSERLARAGGLAGAAAFFEGGARHTAWQDVVARQVRSRDF